MMRRFESEILFIKDVLLNQNLHRPLQFANPHLLQQDMPSRHFSARTGLTRR